MSLTSLFNIVLTALTAFFFVLFMLVLEIQQLQSETVKSEEVRFQSYRLAEELRQSSDDLTRMARSYAATGEEKYLKYYKEILAIRNGEKPRPQNYSTTYWYLMPGGVTKPEKGEKIRLEELMEEMGFTKHELELFKLSRTRSDDLVKLEKEAFAAMEGYFDDGAGNFTVKKAPNPDLAVQLLEGDRYQLEKVKIMEPIDHFLKAVDQRTEKDLVQVEEKERTYLRSVVAVLGGFMVLVPFMAMLLRRQIMVPLTKLVERSQQIAKGDYKGRMTLHGVEELSLLNEGFNEMSAAIERELQAYQEVQNALKQSEANLTRAQEIAKIGSWLLSEGLAIRLSEEAKKICELQLDELTNEEFMSLVHPDDRELVESAWSRALKGQAFDIEHRIVTADERVKWVQSKAQITIGPDGTHSGIGTIQDITERKLADMRDNNRRYILELIAKGTNVHFVLEEIAEALEDECDGAVCAVMIADESRTHLRHGAGPNLPDFYNQAMDELEIGPGNCSCGTAAYTKEFVIVEDVLSHPYWVKFKEAAQLAGIRSCWSQPILDAQGELLGTIAVHHKRPSAPSVTELRVVQSTAHLAAIAIEHANAIEQLRAG